MVAAAITIAATVSAIRSSNPLNQRHAAEVAVAVTLDIRTTVGAVEFMVGDDGPGIPDANVDAIFQPFFTTKPEGSGVGLALARQIFRAHVGDLVLFAVQPARFLAALPI